VSEKYPYQPDYWANFARPMGASAELAAIGNS